VVNSWFRGITLGADAAAPALVADVDDGVKYHSSQVLRHHSGQVCWLLADKGELELELEYTHVVALRSALQATCFSPLVTHHMSMYACVCALALWSFGEY
jgi:hypothetical protein